MVIYKITNLVNGKVYIGQTRRSLKRRWQEHRRELEGVLGRAIQKYGVLNFSVDVICIASSVDELNALEKFHIAAHDSTNHTKGYNIATGGEAPPPWTGKKHSESTRRKISRYCRGLQRSEETKRKISAFRKQFHYSGQAKENISKSKKGLNHPLYGKRHSPETIERMRLSALKRWAKE